MVAFAPEPEIAQQEELPVSDCVPPNVFASGPARPYIAFEPLSLTQPENS